MSLARQRCAEQLNALDPAASHACLCAYKTNSKMSKHAEEQRTAYQMFIHPAKAGYQKNKDLDVVGSE